MLPLIDDNFFVNHFVETQLPTKAEIFDRTGKVAVAPDGVYTGENAALIGRAPTESAERFVREAESYERPQPEKPQDNE